MSSTGSDTPLLIRLKPSRRYHRLIYAIHLLSLIPILFACLNNPVALFLLPLLYLSLHMTMRRYQLFAAWRQCRCHVDGRVERLGDDVNEVERFQLSRPPLLFSQLVILPLKQGRQSYWMPLFADSTGRRQWKALQRFLRYSLQ